MITCLKTRHAAGVSVIALSHFEQSQASGNEIGGEGFEEESFNDERDNTDDIEIWNKFEQIKQFFWVIFKFSVLQNFYRGMREKERTVWHRTKNRMATGNETNDSKSGCKHTLVSPSRSCSLDWVSTSNLPRARLSLLVNWNSLRQFKWTKYFIDISWKRDSLQTPYHIAFNCYESIYY